MTLPPGRAQLNWNASYNGIRAHGDLRSDNLVASRAACKPQSEAAMMTSGLAATSSRANFGISSLADTNIDYKIAAIDEATLGEFGQNHAAIFGSSISSSTPIRQLLRLLRMHRQWPRRDACKASDELSPHITGLPIQ